MQPGNCSKAVKTALCHIGRDDFRYHVYARDVDEECTNGGEWLYDVTWLEYGQPAYARPRPGELTAAPLVAECEWGNKGDIEDDFEKLLLARAGVRVMIFDGGIHTPRITELLARKVREFNGSRAEDAWLLAAWKEHHGGFHYFTFQMYTLIEFHR